MSLQTDPIGYKDGLNWYAYVGNDPLNRSDPTGMLDEPTPLSEVEVGGRSNDGWQRVGRNAFDELMKTFQRSRLPFETSQLTRTACPAVSNLMKDSESMQNASVAASKKAVKTGVEQGFWVSQTYDGRIDIFHVPAAAGSDIDIDAGKPPAGRYKVQLFVHAHTWTNGPTPGDTQQARGNKKRNISPINIATLVPPNTVFYRCPH